MPGKHAALGSIPSNAEPSSDGAQLKSQHWGGRGRRVRGSKTSLANGGGSRPASDMGDKAKKEGREGRREGKEEGGRKGRGG